LARRGAPVRTEIIGSKFRSEVHAHCTWSIRARR
jgi:hypothetical protein